MNIKEGKLLPELELRIEDLGKIEGIQSQTDIFNKIRFYLKTAYLSYNDHPIRGYWLNVNKQSTSSRGDSLSYGSG